MLQLTIEKIIAEEIQATEIDKRNIAYCKKKHKMPEAEEHVYRIKIYFTEEPSITTSLAFKLYLGETKEESCQIDKYAGFKDKAGQGVLFKIFNPYELKEYGDKPIAIKWPSDEKRAISKFTINDAINSISPNLDKPNKIDKENTSKKKRKNEKEVSNNISSFFYDNDHDDDDDDTINDIHNKHVIIKVYKNPEKSSSDKNDLEKQQKRQRKFNKDSSDSNSDSDSNEGDNSAGSPNPFKIKNN